LSFLPVFAFKYPFALWTTNFHSYLLFGYNDCSSLIPTRVNKQSSLIPWIAATFYIDFKLWKFFVLRIMYSLLDHAPIAVQQNAMDL
jgi:hypothetical protein